MGDKDAKEKLERVKAIRAANRGVITKKITDVNEILNGGTINDDQRKALEVLDRLLESKLKTVEELDQSVLSLCSIDAIQAEIEDSEKVLERVVECQKRVHEALQRHKGKSNEHENHSGQTQPTLGTNPAKAKLPKLILPKFRGDVTKWSSFWDSFRSAVHENAAISPVEKFNYLNSLLEGPASRAIQGLSLTDANYRSAVEILQERFGRPQQIISAHMDELLKIPNCSGTERSTSLRFVYDQISVHVRGLSSLGVASDQYGGLLIPVIMAKLPNEIRVRVARETKGSVWKIDGILEIIKQEVEAREMSEGVKVQEERSSKQTAFQQPRNPKHSMTSSFLIAKREQMNRTTQTRCVYCNELHYSASCEKVVNPRDRRNILIEAKRCFKCLFPGHQVKDCTNSRNCRNCGGRHHQSVCFSHFGARESPPVHPPRTRNEPGLINDGESGALGSTVTATSSTKAKGSVLLQTATAIATNEDRSKSVPVRILFDNGSQRSYVTNNLKSKLGLKPTSSETLHLNTFGERAYRKQSCEVVTLPLRNKRNEYLEISALNFPVICSPLPKSVDIDDYPHLQGLELADSSESQCGIDILIGSDHYWDIVTGESIRGNFGPTAINSKFGWLLSGPTNIPSSTNDSNVVSNLIISGEPFLNEANDNDEIVSMLKTFWETESAGIVDDSMCERQVPNITVKRNDISFNGRHYETGLPWKEDCAPTSNNYGMCVSRLRSLHHKLKNEPNLLSEYDKIIQQQCETGIVERVPKSNSANELDATSVHYSPHHAVVRRNRETTKVRIVYDGSAKCSKKERSLNDCLEVGENYIPHIFDMLAKFRWNAVALTADIEKAFLMVGIKKQDRDMLRFLWYDDPFATKPEIVEFRFNRLVFGLRPSPSILGATISHHLRLYKQSEPEMAELLEKSLYVDDLLTGDGNDDKALVIYKKSKQIMAEGGFNLRKWNSNSRTLLKAIESCENPSGEPKSNQETTKEDDESYAKSSTTLGSSEAKNDTIVKVLGLNWNTVSDEFFFDFTELYNYGSSLPATKRSILKLTAKIFDPIGFLTPFTIEMKILFQELCLGKIDWDTDLQGTLLLTWNKLLEELKWLSNVRIPRCYFQSNPVEIELHGFSDASNRAYAAVVYMRSLYQDGRVDVRLVASKSRVAPLKKQSIPRLELLGAVLLARLADKFNSTGKQLKTINWTDSMTALCWIKNERMWKQYVQHRVQEIRNLTSKDSWRHCPGEFNPADIPSRGLSAKELSTNSTWWNGAEFLYRPEAEWPVNRLTESEDKVALEEAVKNPPAITYSLVNTSNETQGKKVDQIIDVKRFPDLTRLLRVTALVIKCAKRFKNQVRNEKRTEKEETRITASDIKEAEHLWIRSVQVSSFSRELAFLLSKDRNSNPPTYVTQFGLFLDEDVIKCKGRLNNAPLPVNTRNPILLPAKHEFTHLLIKQSHECVKHSGIRDTLTTLRERYWVPRGREAVKKIIRSCVICRKHEGTPFSSLPPTDLPSNRVSEDPPFTHIGLDFAGPLYVETKNSEGETRESQKVYVCLFTCASTRAVHLELTRSLSVESFLLAFRRFTSRRGLPATITSDNAKTFRSSSRDIRNIARAEEVWRFLANKQITWTFIIERAPWWGGFWERLVRSIKKPLKKIVGRSTLSFDELRTILVEIEGVVNSRLLTYVYDDEESLSYPLTPSDLIYGRRITSTPNAAHYEVISTNQSLTKKSRHHRHVLRQLTNQWRREYLIELRERSQVKSKGSNNRPIAIGDLVLLKNDSTSRAFWKLGKVEELIPGRDGNVRAAVVKVGSDSGHVSHLRRVVQQLVPIEVKVQPEATCTPGCTATSEVRAVNQNARPRRAAAATGEALRRELNIV